MLARIISSALATLALNLFPLEGLPRLALFTAVYLLIGYDILWEALCGLWNRQFLDENFLMAIATVGAFALAVYTRSGDYNEAVAVMLFYQTGELFQSIAVGKSRKNIAELMDIRPDFARVERGGIVEVDPAEVTLGETILVRPGDRVPIDGVIIEGCGTLDTSALTGESLPREVGVGESVVSGCVNLTGLIRIRTEKEFSESTVSRILELVENASSRKSRSEKFISKFARVYTPAVCGASLALAVIPPLCGLGEWHSWLYRALTFLVISCPCALVISIPLTFFAGIGCASREGILVKGSNYLEALAEVKTVALDKTGTLTRGVFEVTEIIENTIEKDKLLDLAAHVEAQSTHPIAKSIAATCKNIDLSRVSDVREIGGIGVTCKVDGIEVAVGRHSMIEGAPDYSGASTAVYVSVSSEFAGIILVSDAIKDESGEAITELKRIGIEKCVMLTGDGEAIAKLVSEKLGIDEYRASLLPADKITEVEALLSERAKLAFVGDGINDAPVLARADVGIAMGAMGSDAAIEAADVVLMKDDPRDVAKAISISRKCLSIVKQNIIFSLAVKFGCLALVAMGFADMWLGIFADVGVMVLAVLNAIRAMKR